MKEKDNSPPTDTKVKEGDKMTTPTTTSASTSSAVQMTDAQFSELISNIMTCTMSGNKNFTQCALEQHQTFLQTASWYRRFIENFAEIARPLTWLTKKTVKWQWENEQQKAYEKLKTALTTTPVLKQADYEAPFTIKTDASNYAIGPALVQGEGPNEHPIEYASRLLTSAELNYTVTEKEALAIVWAISRFKGYIEGNKFLTAITDHQPLKWLLNFIPDITPHLKNLAKDLALAKANVEMMQDNNRARANQKRCRPDPGYNIGDLVLVETHPISSQDKQFSAKFAPRRDGPYIILKKHGSSIYEIATIPEPEISIGKYHASAIVKFEGRNDDTPAPDPILPLRRRGRPRKNRNS